MYNFEYMNKVEELLHKVDDANKEKIQELAVKFADNIKNNHIIHVFGTGHSHMIGIELFCRAGGLGNVNAILDPDALTNATVNQYARYVRSGASKWTNILSGLKTETFYRP